MYCQDVALKGGDLTAQQRAIDFMFLGIWEDCIGGGFAKCMYGNEETKKAGIVALPAHLEKFLTSIESRLPESGFVHGRDVPSMADITCFCTGMSLKGFGKITGND